MPDSALKIEDLPAWMRPRRRVIDWGLLVVIAFALLASWPFLSRPGLPRNNDAVLYESRSLEVAQLLRANVFYARWAPDFTYRYGSPVFNFLAPLPHYLSGYHQALTDTDPVNSVRMLFVLSIVAAASGMYLFAQQRWGTATGVLATLIYLYSPPLVLTLPYILSDLSLLMALGLLPWAVWSLDRITLQPRPRSVVLAIICVSAFILSDTRIAALGSIVIVVMALFSGKRAWRCRLYTLIAVAAVTAFFWLPALLDLKQVHWLSAQLDSTAAPLSWAESFSGMPYIDRGVLDPAPYRGIGVATWLLAIPGGIAILRRIRHKMPSAALALLALGSSLLAVSIIPGWAQPTAFQPLLPYHLTLVAIFCLATVGAHTVYWLEWLGRRARIGQIVGLAALCLVPLLASLPALNVPDWTVDPNTTSPVTTYQQDELQGYHLATLREGVLLPVTASRSPEPIPPLPGELTSEAQQGPIDRLNRQQFSPNVARLGSQDRTPLYDSYLLNVTQPNVVEFYLLAYPGWSARADEQPLPIKPTPQGMVSVQLPISRGLLVVWLEEPSLHTVSWLIGLIAVLGSMLALRRWRTTEVDPTALDLLPRRQVIGLVILLVVYAAAALWLLQTPGLLAQYTVTQYATQNPIIALRRFFIQGGIDLLGYQLPTLDSQNSILGGDPLTVNVFWKAGRPILNNVQSGVVLVAANNPANVATDNQSSPPPIAQLQHRHPGGIPTLRWPLDRYVRDSFTLTAPLTPGDYQIRIQLGNCDKERILPCDRVDTPDASDEFGHTEAGGVTIPQVIHVR